MSASIFIYISACYLASKHGICLFGRHYDNFTCIIMFYISSFWKESREWYKSALLAKTLRKFDEFLFPLSQSDNRKWHWNEKFNRHKQRNCFLIFCNHIFVVEHITLRDRTYFHLDWANSLPKSRRNEKCVTVWYTCSNGPNLCRRFWPFYCLGTIRCRCTHIFTSTVIMENNMRLIVRAFRCHLRQFLHCMLFVIHWESLRQLSSDKNLDSQIVSHFIFRHLSSHFSFSLSLVIYSFLVAVHYFNCYNAAAVNWPNVRWSVLQKSIIQKT